MTTAVDTWHNDAVPVAVGTAGVTWRVLASTIRWAIILFPFIYFVFIAVVLAFVGAYDFQTRVQLFLSSDCGKLHQFVFVFMWIMIALIFTASVAIIYAWEHVLWVKFIFPIGSSLLVIVGAVFWCYEAIKCSEYFEEHVQGISTILHVNTIILVVLSVLAWYNALSKAPIVLGSFESNEYQPIGDTDGAPADSGAKDA